MDVVVNDIFLRNMIRAIQTRLNETVNDMWVVFGKLLTRGKTLNELERDSEKISESSTHFLEQQMKMKKGRWTNFLWQCIQYYGWCYCCDRNKIHKKRKRVVEV